MIGKESDSGYASNSFRTYEIFIVACAAYSLPCGVMFRRAAASSYFSPKSGEISRYTDRRIPTAATAVQPKWTGSIHRHAATGTSNDDASAYRCCADKSC
jgi:hypothetical protein